MSPDSAFASNYIPVLINAGDDHKNQLRSVRVEKRVGNALVGYLI
jgi:hypothetical protein